MKQNPIALLLKWSGKNKKYLLLSVVCSFVGGLFAIGSYIGIYNLMDALVTHTCNRKIIVYNAILITSTIIIRQIFIAISGVTSHKGAYNALFLVRCMITEHLAKVPLGVLDERRTGDIKTLINEDVEKMERTLAHNLPEFVSYFTGPVVIFIYLLTVNKALAVITLIPLAIIIVIMILMFARMMPVMDKAGATAANFNSVIIEYISGMRLIKAYNMGSKSFKKFQNAIEEENHVWNEMSVKTGPLYAAFIVALECGLIFLVPIGGKWFLDGSISVSVFLLFVYVGSMYLTELLPLQQMSMELAQVIVGIQKVKEILDIPVFESEGKFPDTYDIQMKNVSFAYNDEADSVLKDCNLVVKERERLALVGVSGAGKSTIIQLISRYYDANEGSVFIGGKDVKDISYEELLENIAIVFQKSFLTSGTILENIKMGKDATLKQVRAAARKASIDDFIMSLPKQYDTEVGEINTRFSGGEKQRIAIARAILKDAPILILDEATSAADPENQNQIDQAIENLCEGKTVVIVAHRLDIVKRCDRVAIVENKHISAIGTHEEVLDYNAYYRNAWNIYREAQNVSYKIS